MRRPARRLLVAALAAALAALAAALGIAPAGEVYGGPPRVEGWLQAVPVHALRNPGFTIGYSEWRRQPLWVAYRAQRPPQRPLGPRPGHFTVDARTLARVASEDYHGSGYDRGHLAPNFLIGKLHGVEGQAATFLMSNVAPQTRRLNQLVWQRLEEVEADRLAPATGEFWVFAGPVFGENPRRLRSGIHVPEAFYRIWVSAVRPDHTGVLGFVVPQAVCGTEPLSRFLASVDQIERLTGLDFLHALEDTLEQDLEGSVRAAPWAMERYDRLPPRYGDNFDLSTCPRD